MIVGVPEAEHIQPAIVGHGGKPVTTGDVAADDVVGGDTIAVGVDAVVVFRAIYEDRGAGRVDGHQHEEGQDQWEIKSKRLHGIPLSLLTRPL